MTSRGRPEGTEWTPATSNPGELYTVEGRSRATWAFLSGAKNKDPRLKAHRREMRHTAVMVVGMLTAVFVAVAVLVSILG